MHATPCLRASVCNGGVRRKTLATFGAQEALEIQESLEATEGCWRPLKAQEEPGGPGNRWRLPSEAREGLKAEEALEAWRP